MQGYTPPAYWKPIGEVRRALDIPVVANGEIWSVDDLERCIEQSGCIHFMVGRGALANPLLALECAKRLGIEHSQFEQCAQQSRGFSLWRELLTALINLSRDMAESERRTVSRLKQWVNYARHRGQIDWFDKIKRCHDTADITRAFAEIARADSSSRTYGLQPAAYYEFPV
jgi:tRNA-dihydrouridine synthase C